MPLSQRSSFTLDSVSSGRVWVTLGKPLNSSTFPSPDTSDVRFDTVELTYPGVANLTAVDMLGIPMDIETFDAGGRIWWRPRSAPATPTRSKTAVKARIDRGGWGLQQGGPHRRRRQLLARWCLRTSSAAHIPAATHDSTPTSVR
ncbi:MAG: hypothetical protein V9E98_07565 [Candidatus Nanopelagicales bacterium]